MTENTIATLRISDKILARRSADNRVTLRLFGTGTNPTAFDEDEVGELAAWLARKVAEDPGACEGDTYEGGQS